MGQIRNAEQFAGTPTKRVSLEAVVIRADGSREDLGTVAYWHRSRLRRAVWKLKNMNRR